MKSQNNLKVDWNLKLLYKGDNDPKMVADRKALELENQKFIKKWKSRSDYLNDPKVLKIALDEYEALMRNFGFSGKEGFYFWLRFHQDQIDPRIKASQNKLEEFDNKMKNQIQFFELNLAKIDPKLQKKFLDSPELLSYRHFLEKLFAQAKHTLTDAEEKIMNLKSTPAYSNWVKMVSGFTSKEERKTLLENGKMESKNLNELLTLINSQKKRVRDSAAKGLNEIFGKFAEVATEELNSILMDKKINDELRGFTRPEASRFLSDDIDPEIVDNLVKVVSNHFDSAARFYKLKAKLLKLKKLTYHERNVEYGKLDQKYSYKDSVDLVRKVLNNLDPEFAEIFAGFVENGQIDVYPKKGKWGGAFCVYWLQSLPTYVLLNYTDTLNDVITIAHELGHGINNELIKKAQNALNFGTPTSTAEIASVFMEDYVIQELIKEADEKLKLEIMVSTLNREVSTLHRQIACFRFEQELHLEFRKKGFLSTKDIGEIFQKHMSAYMGPAVERSEGSENWWVYWSHIRTYFYTYAYAGGILIAKALQSLVREDPKNIEKVKYFLSAGMSESPKQIFKSIGIDISKSEFWERGIGEFEKLLSETEKLARKLKKI